jgi:hypothetical protein
MTPEIVTFQSRILGFNIEAYSMTPEGYKLNKSFPFGGEMPQYFFGTKIRFHFEPDLTSLTISIEVSVRWGIKSTGDTSPVLATIQTATIYELIGAEQFVEGNNFVFPQLILRTFALDAIASTRGAFVVKNAGTPLADALIPMAGDQLLEANLNPTQSPGILESEVEVLFDVYEYEKEVIQGMPPVPTYGVEVINHKPHAIRVTDHYLETFENGFWRKVEHVMFDDRSERVEFEKAGKLYVENRRKLPKTLKPNARFLWRIIGMPHTDKKMIIRGALVADKKPYHSEPFEYDGSFKSRAMYREK